MRYMRMAGAGGLLIVLVVLVVVVQILVARNRDYLADVPFAVDLTVGPTDARAPIELRVLGDSTAAGVGTDRPREALPALLAERVAERTGRAVHVVGLGVSGARTADLTDEQIPMVRDADIVVLVVGSNDVIHVTPPSRMRENTAQMLDAAVAGGVPVVLGGIPRFYGVGAFAQPLRAMVDAYASVLREVQRDVARAAPAVAFVDIAALASPRFRGVPESMSSDQFHPSEIGYGYWADALAPAVVAELRHMTRR